MLECYPAWEMIRRRLEAFWEREIIDRPIIQVTAPQPSSVPYPSTEGMTLEQQWTDPAYQMAVLDAQLAHTYYAGDAFPTYRPSFGPSYLAGLLGAPVEYQDGTVWYYPCITDLESTPLPHFDREGLLWQQLASLMRAAADHAPARFILGQVDMVPPTDILAALMGPGELCMAMIEQPEAVERWLQSLTESFIEIYRAQEAMLPAENGYTGWLTAWTPKRSYDLQNDFSCMISAEMFRRFCLPELVALTEFLDYTIYHLDGPGAIQHLDALLELPHLHVIQWTPGDGQPPMSSWIPLLQRIQQAGKGLFIYCEPQEIEVILRDIAPEGVIFSTWASSPEEADALIRLGL